MTAKEMTKADQADKERAFVDAVLKGYDVTVSAELAGYVSHYGYSLAKRPKIQRMIYDRLATRLVGEALPLAVDFIVKAIGDEDFSPKIRLEAAKTAMQYAGLEHAIGGNVSKTKDLTEMDPDELRKFIDQAETELAGQAKPIGPVKPANSAPVSTQVSDLFD